MDYEVLNYVVRWIDNDMLSRRQRFYSEESTVSFAKELSKNGCLRIRVLQTRSLINWDELI